MEENEYFKRANFFPGLKAAPGFWNEMEDYHFRKETLYNSLFHGSGIVPDYKQSLHVQAEKTKGGLITLLVGSGLAIDGCGRPVFLYEPQALARQVSLHGRGRLSNTSTHSAPIPCRMRNSTSAQTPLLYYYASAEV